LGRVWGPGSGPGREADPCIPSSIYVPSLEYIDLMETTQYMNEEELHVLADTYDSVYLHPVWMGTVRAEGGGHPGIPHSHIHTTLEGVAEWTWPLSSLSPSFPSLTPHCLLQNSYTCACLASGSVLRLVDAVLEAEIRNGMAIIR